MQRARTVIVLVATVTGAAHCDSAVPTEESGRLEPADEVLPPPWRARWEEPERPPMTEAQALQGERAALERIEALRSSSVTSTASGDDGSSFVSGTFSGALRFGSRILTSQGGDDVFLARVGPDGDVAWARAVGSRGKEREPNVSFEDGRVKLLAMTDGAVDCGRGPLQTWSSEAFFLCTFEPDGEPIDGASFPTGRR